MTTTHRPVNAHRGPTPAMQYALALVADGMSQRKAAAEAGVSLAGLVKALTERLRAAGLVPVQVWVRPERKAEVMALDQRREIALAA